MTVLLVTILPLSKGDLSAANEAQITSGLDTGEAIANVLSSGDFKESMKKIGTSVGQYLGVLGPFMGLVLSFVPASESAELKYMKDMMDNIDTRFDRLDSRFNDIERKIEWTATEVTFGQLELNILSLAKTYELLYGTSPEGKAFMKAEFVRKYENNYDNSGEKLYTASVSSGTIVENLGVSAMRKTKNDRKETNIFLLGIMQLLLQAAKLDISYFQAKNSSDVEVEVEHTTSVWEERILEVKDKFEEIDHVVASNYHNQSGKDIDEYAAYNDEISNEDFSSRLYDMLVAKYYWRDWFVVIYDPIQGLDKHAVFFSGGHTKFQRNERNIVISSTDRNSPKLDLNAAQRSLEACNDNPRCIIYHIVDVPCLTRNVDYYSECYFDRNAKDIRDGIKQPVGAKSWGAIKRGSDVWYRYDNDRRVFSSTTRTTDYGGKFDLHMWG